MNNFKRIIEPFKADLETDRAIAHVWRVQDVLKLAPTLTEEEAMEVLDHVLDNLDANRGITWAVVRESINEVIDGKKEYRHGR